MVRPREHRPEQQTPLQKAKSDFVLGLGSRRRRRPEELEQRVGESRLQALGRALQEGEVANANNPWAGSEKRRDKLRAQLGFWWAIGADAAVIHWIGFGVRLFFEEQPERVYFPNHASYWEYQEHVEAEHE